MLLRLTAALLMLFVSVPGGLAGGMRKLTGPQIIAKLGGMQFTDEVHWREVYEKDGTVRNYEMGRNRLGKWRIRKDELCINLGDDGDNNCFEVWLQGDRIVMRRNAEDKYPNEGVLERPTDSKPVSGAKP